MNVGTHLKRNTILVADIERSLTIYRDILGFTIDKITVSEDDSYSYPVFRLPPEAKMRFCTLNSVEEVRALALTEVKGIELPKYTSGPILNGNVIRVEDLNGVMEKIKALGLEHTELETDHDEERNFTFNEQSFVDFDGHLVVIYEVI